MRMRGDTMFAAKQGPAFTGEVYVTDEVGAKIYGSGYLLGWVLGCWGAGPQDGAFSMQSSAEYWDIIEKGDMLFAVMSSCFGSGPSGTPPGSVMFTFHAERLDEE
jgi:hypothetical protein